MRCCVCPVGFSGSVLCMKSGSSHVQILHSNNDIPSLFSPFRIMDADFVYWESTSSPKQIHGINKGIAQQSIEVSTYLVNITFPKC